MKKIIFSFALMLVCVFNMDAQVVISSFKFCKDQPTFETKAQGRRMVELKFTVTGERDVKKLTVHYSGVNRIGDAVCSDIYGGVNANVEHTLYHSVTCVGPVKAGKKGTTLFRGVFYSKMKELTAFPRQIEIVYMGENEPEIIDITKENINTFFPKIEWIDVYYKE